MKEDIKKIIDFVKESVKWLEEKQEGCCELRLKNGSDLSLFVGWAPGYDENDNEYIHAENDPTWCITAGIKGNKDFLKCDFEWLTAPYDEKTGDVWETDITIDAESKTIDAETATYFLKEFYAMEKALKSGKIKL